MVDLSWVLIGLVVVLLYRKLIRPLSYWKRRGIPQKSVFYQWLEITRDVLQLKSKPDMQCLTYNEFPEERCSGTYRFFTPILWVKDPDLIKQIAVKDFEYFVDHEQRIPEGLEPLWEKGLFFLKGDAWRNMRTILSPSFTSSKMKSTYILIKECAQQFVDHLREGNGMVEFRDAYERLFNDLIASTAFGLTCNSLKNRDNEFYLMGKEATTKSGLWYNLRCFAILLSPQLCRIMDIGGFSSPVKKFFRQLVKSNIESREKNGIIRPDMIHLLMEAKKRQESGGNGVVLSNDDLAAQSMVFFFAGFKSVSAMMCFLMYELAVNCEIQETLRKEVDAVAKSNSALTYESLLGMRYMDLVVSEVLRKWPTVLGVDRMCVKPYTIQPSKEGELPIHLRKGDVVWLPIYAMHRDPKFYPNPDRFDPHRFNEENKGEHTYSYIPFGVGPRICIGNRLAMVEAKTTLFYIIASFEIRVTEKTAVPITLSKDLFGLDSDRGFWFQLVPRAV